MGALSALYHHLSTVEGIGFAPGSQQITYQAAEGKLNAAKVVTVAKNKSHVAFS